MSNTEIEDINKKLVLFEEMFISMKMAIIELEKEIEILRDDNEDNLEALEENINEKVVDIKRDIIEDIIDKLKTI